MVRNVPERVKKAYVAFNEEVRLRLCESSGSEHSSSADSPTDLFDLVASFVEGEGEPRAEEGLEGSIAWGVDGRGGCGGFDYDTAKDTLEKIFEWNEDKRMILHEVEAACISIGHEENSPDFKRRLMGRLRKRSLDAGLCKSRWEKMGRFPKGDYQYIDVNMDGARYIVEVSLAMHFEIARPTGQFDSLLKLLPPIFVGTSGELKEVVRVLSAAIRQSLKSRGLDLPPWRKHGYMKAKWFSSYKRTTSLASKQKCANIVSGFDFVPSAGYYCRDKHKTGLLTQALAGPGQLAISMPEQLAINMV
ncbi:hypothetical protein MLD38_040592 [Melastoma candidum]|nr:hypothetical protein MLD38_040592 [Melastoma candidum]